jgi:hypothetical protein
VSVSAGVEIKVFSAGVTVETSVSSTVGKH